MQMIIVHRLGHDVCLECEMRTGKISWQMTSCYYLSWKHLHSTLTTRY